MFFMVWVLDRFEKLSISTRAAHVFGRTCSLTIETHRECYLVLRMQYLFNNNIVFPTITKIILIQKRVSFMGGDLAQRVATFVNDRQLIMNVGNAVAFAINGELMQVAVGPAHRSLNHLVQFIEIELAGYHYPPPNRRLAFTQRDFELIIGAARWS